MILDLGPLPYKFAYELINWCWEHSIDEDQCLNLIHASTCKPVPNIEWKINIPDKYVTFFLLKWSARLSELQIQEYGDESCT